MMVIVPFFLALHDPQLACDFFRPVGKFVIKLYAGETPPKIADPVSKPTDLTLLSQIIRRSSLSTLGSNNGIASIDSPMPELNQITVGKRLRKPNEPLLCRRPLSLAVSLFVLTFIVQHVSID